MIFLHHALGRWTVGSGGRLQLKGRGGHRRLLALFLTCNTLRFNAKIAKLFGGSVPPRPLRSAVYESRRSLPVIKVKGTPFSPFDPILTGTYRYIQQHLSIPPPHSLNLAAWSRHASPQTTGQPPFTRLRNLLPRKLSRRVNNQQFAPTRHPHPAPMS